MNCGVLSRRASFRRSRLPLEFSGCFDQIGIVDDVVAPEDFLGFVAADLHSGVLRHATANQVSDGRPSEVVGLQAHVLVVILAVFSLRLHIATEPGCDAQRVPVLSRIPNRRAIVGREHVVVGVLAFAAGREKREDLGGHPRFATFVVLRRALLEFDPAIEEVALADSQIEHFATAKSKGVAASDGLSGSSLAPVAAAPRSVYALTRIYP